MDTTHRTAVTAGARIGAIALILMMGAIRLSAFTLEPISRTFRPSGPESSRVFRVSNPSDRRIAVGLQMLSRELLPDGSEVREPVGGLFSVFPSQMILEPGSRQNVRVRWTGPQRIDREQSFRLVAEQLPVDFGDQAEQEGGSIKFVFRYLAAVYVTPPGAAPEVTVRIDERAGEPEQGLWVMVENRGTRHTILDSLALTVADGDTLLGLFPPEELRGLSGENLLAGSARRYFLPMETAAAGRATTVTFTLAR